MTKKILHLKENGGRYFYRRRVPERHQKTLGIKMWNRPCGDVSYQKAVALVTGWAEEDDVLIQSLDDPTVSQPIRQATEAKKMSDRLTMAETAKQAIFGLSAARPPTQNRRWVRHLLIYRPSDTTALLGRNRGYCPPRRRRSSHARF